MAQTVIDGLTFVDTNVLLHAEDGREPDRRDLAAGVLAIEHGRRIGGLTIANPFRTSQPQHSEP